MAEKVFNLETVHDTARRTMTQTISPFSIVVDWNNDTIKVMKNDEVIDLICFDNKFGLDDYEKLLEQVEISANELKSFSHD